MQLFSADSPLCKKKETVYEYIYRIPKNSSHKKFFEFIF